MSKGIIFLFKSDIGQHQLFVLALKIVNAMSTVIVYELKAFQE